MSNYLILYRSRGLVGEQMAGTPEEMQASMNEWMAWGGAMGPHLIDFGAPTMPTSAADPGPVGWVSGYSIVEAADLDALEVLLEKHPHRSQGTIEVLEMLPMPSA